MRFTETLMPAFHRTSLGLIVYDRFMHKHMQQHMHNVGWSNKPANATQSGKWGVLSHISTTAPGALPTEREHLHCGKGT
jgi:hypothetical protein